MHTIFRALILSLTLICVGACSAETSLDNASNTFVGEAASGKDIFSSRCAACHSSGSDRKVGPGLAGLFSAEGPTLPPEVDYDGKLPSGEPITEASVARWIRTGGAGEIGYMPGQGLDDSEMADLLAYLKTLSPE